MNYLLISGNIWSFSAHSKEVTGLSLSPLCPGLLCSTSPDGLLKIWDCKLLESEPQLVQEKDFKMGVVHCLDFNPNSPFVIAAGGDNKSNYFTVLDLMSIDTGK